MRYRIFEQGKLVMVFGDRPSFDRSFVGKNPNKPVGGIVACNGVPHEVAGYKEFAGGSLVENEFHETEQDWFAHVEVI